MSGKAKSPHAPKRQRNQVRPAHRFLDPAVQRAALEELLVRQKTQPIDDFDQFLEEVGKVWPKGENLDEFLIWLRATRRGEAA